MKTRKYLQLTTLGIYFFLAIVQPVKAQWTVSQEIKDQKLQIEFTPENVEKGKELYALHCKSCHGEPGKNNSLPLNPKPLDFASAEFQSRSEGELFHKITVGKGQMPAFEKVLDENSRYNLIAFTKSLSSKTETKISGNIKIKLSANEKDSSLNAVLTDEKGQPASGIKVDFSAKRIFGDWIFAEKKASNNFGYVNVKFPKDLPGDSVGTVKIYVRFSEKDRFGKSYDSISLAWGQSFIYVNPLNERAMWGTRANAPIWLVLTYTLVVIGVWTGILYVVLQIVKLRKRK